VKAVWYEHIGAAVKQEQAQEGSFNSPELFPILMVLEISKQ